MVGFAVLLADRLVDAIVFADFAVLLAARPLILPPFAIPPFAAAFRLAGVAAVFFELRFFAAIDHLIVTHIFCTETKHV
jgi:hypothetical protein